MLEATDGEAEVVVDGAHPDRVAAGQVVVDGDDVDAPAGEGVEIDREGGDEGLALAGFHFGNLTPVEDDAADELDVVVALAEAAAGDFADGGEGLGEQVVQGFAGGQAVAELLGEAGELAVGAGLHFGFEVVDVGDEGLGDAVNGLFGGVADDFAE